MNAFTPAELQTQQGTAKGNVVPSLARLLLAMVRPCDPTAEEQAELDRIVAHGRASVERELGGLTVKEAQERGLLYTPRAA